MATQRITISLPEDVYADLKKMVPAGEVSKFVTEKLRDYIQTMKIRKRESAVDRIMKLRETGPKYSTDEILEFIEKGRM